MKFDRKQKGFTLIELVVVIAILGIIGLIAIPKYFDISTTAKDNALKAQLGNIRAALAVEYARTAFTTGTAAYPSASGTGAFTGDIFADGQIPVEPYNNSNEISVDQDGAAIDTFDDDGGWVYNPVTGEIRPDIAGKHAY